MTGLSQFPGGASERRVGPGESPELQPTTPSFDVALLWNITAQAILSVYCVEPLRCERL